MDLKRMKKNKQKNKYRVNRYKDGKREIRRDY